MLKKGQLAIFIIIALLLVSAIALKFFITKSSPNLNSECETDSQCVPASCCHATSCISTEQAPKCDGIACTLNCEPGTLDCQQASCRCISNKCGLVPN